MLGMFLVANFPVVTISVSHLLVSVSAAFLSHSFELPFINASNFTSPLMLLEGRLAFLT